MSEFQARIGRIRMKNGGADVRVLDQRRPDPDGEDWRGTIVQNARKVAEQSEPDSPLVGYIIVGFYGDGQTSVGFRYDPDRTPIPRMLLPAWIAEVVRRDMITAREAESTFNDMFEWQDGVS